MDGWIDLTFARSLCVTRSGGVHYASLTYEAVDNYVSSAYNVTVDINVMCPAGMVSRLLFTSWHFVILLSSPPAFLFIGAAQFLNATAKQCVACRPGTQLTSPSVLESCAACGVGTASASSGSTKCVRCSPGTFANQTGLFFYL